jgi:hypothetical protein
MSLPYELIPLIAVLGLSMRYAAVPDASARSKCIVGGAAVASLLVGRYVSGLAALVVQIGVSLYVLLYLKVTAEDRRGKP